MKKGKLPYIQTFVDRHKRTVRNYFRRPGFKRVALPGTYGSPEFLSAYQAAIQGEPVPIGASRAQAGSINALVAAYYQSGDFLNLKASTQRTYRNVIERFRNDHGAKSVAGLQPKHVRQLLDGMADRPGAAFNFRRIIRILMGFAVERGWRNDNPTIGVKRLRARSEGFRAWSEADIAKFEERWPLGSRERLALALLLYTAQRRSDVVGMGRQHVKDGFIHVKQQKTDTRLALPVHPELAEALAMAPNQLTFLTTRAGKPFSAAGFTNWFVEAAKEAGLPPRSSPHGLRKAAARRLAEAGCTPHQIMAVTGHKSLSEVALYTAAARQRDLAIEALEVVQRSKAGTKTVKPRPKV